MYFLHEKFEALEAFKAFKMLVEKEVESPIKTLRTDRGGEFNSQEFTNFCEFHGINRQLQEHSRHNKMEFVRGRIALS